MRKLEAIRQAGTVAQDIVVAPSPEDRGLLIADSLHFEPERSIPLPQLIHHKTAGNPFFAIQFMSALAEEGLLTSNHGDGRWSWDVSRISARGCTNNVVDLIVGKLSRLPADTQNAFAAACVPRKQCGIRDVADDLPRLRGEHAQPGSDKRSEVAQLADPSADPWVRWCYSDLRATRVRRPEMRRMEAGAMKLCPQIRSWGYERPPSHRLFRLPFLPFALSGDGAAATGTSLREL
jgi:hypothetical protein